MKRENQAYLYAAGAVFLWSTVATAFKLTLRYMSPAQLLLFAGFVSCLVLLSILAAQNKLRLITAQNRKELLWSAGLGLLNPFFYYVVLFEAYDRLPAQLAQPLNYTWAVTLAFLSVPLLKQSLRRVDLAGALISYLGVIVLCARSSGFAFRFPDPLGVFLALGSTVIWSLYWIYNTLDKRDPVLGLFLNFAFGTVYIFLAALIWGIPFSAPYPGLLGAAYVGVFEMGLAFFLWLKAMKLAESTVKISTLIFFSPFLSLVFIRFLLGERIYSSTFIGLPMIIAGVLLQRLNTRKSTSANNPA